MLIRATQRKWRMLVLALLGIGGIYLSITLKADAYPASGAVNLPAVRQEQAQWCWAASLGAIMSYHGLWTTQCTIVKGLYTTCPNSPASDAQAKTALSRQGFQSTLVKGPISFNNIVMEIYSKRPVYAGWTWTGGGGHAVVIDAYDDGPTDHVEYMDPADGTFHVSTYAWFKSGAGHVWDGTLYRIRR